MDLTLQILVTVFGAMCGIDLSSAMNNFADIQCGYAPQKRSPKIVGGQDASVGEYPWLVSITRRGGHFCGGSVLTKNFILTAGHCLCSGTAFLKANSIRVTFSQHDLSNSNSEAYSVAVKDVILHPEYKCSKVKSDIAILRTVNDIVWSERVRPACFPSAVSQNGYDRFDDTSAVVAGWGWLNEQTHAGNRATVLQKAKVNVITNDKCKQWYRSQGKKTQIQDSQMCAGHEQGGVDACWADSGGPLMVTNGDQTIVVGVVSTGIGCARPHLPGLYTRVSEFIPWIQSVIGK